MIFSEYEAAEPLTFEIAVETVNSKYSWFRITLKLQVLNPRWAVYTPLTREYMLHTWHLCHAWHKRHARHARHAWHTTYTMHAISWRVQVPTKSTKRWASKELTKQTMADTTPRTRAPRFLHSAMNFHSWSSKTWTTINSKNTEYDWKLLKMLVEHVTTSVQITTNSIDCIRSLWISLWWFMYVFQSSLSSTVFFLSTVFFFLKKFRSA